MTDTTDDQMPADPFSPVMSMSFPTLNAFLDDTEHEREHEMLEDLTVGMVKLIDEAHTHDHRAQDGGGDHRVTMSVCMTLERTLMDLYSEHPEILARALVTMASGVALSAGEPE